MKKIKFGSFPLIDMSKQDRHCIDNYSIKNFADLITLNTQMTHIQSDTQKYITPDVILKYFNNPISEAIQNPDANNKTSTMKRAFRALQDFHKSISGNPFYADKVTFPIYLENENKNGSHDYDFILLSNDLVGDESLDEIKYDDKVVLTFLFLKDMLYPKTRLSDLGLGKDDDTSFDIRGSMAKFIEFSRNNDTDPISAMVKLIKIAGMKKSNGKLQNGLVNFVQKNKALNESISQKFFNLFGGTRKSGEIKDIHFLLNEIKHIDIAKFFDDTSPINKLSHTNLSNINSTQSSGLERQYLAQKTQEYNKVLSMVDSLVNFNLTKDVMVDAASDLRDGVVKLISNTEHGEISVDVNIDHDKLIDSVRNDYFDFLVRTLVEKTNTLLKVTSSDLEKKVSNTSYLHDRLADKSIDGVLTIWQDELKSVDIKIYQVLNSNSVDANIDASRLKNERADIERKINQLLLQKSFMVQTQEEQAFAEAKAKQVQSALTFNTDQMQSELVGLLHTIEADIYDSTTYQNLMNTIGSGKSFTPSQLEETKMMQNLKFSIEQLTISIRTGIAASAINSFIINTTTNNQAAEAEQVQKIQLLLTSDGKNLERIIDKYIRESLHVFFTKLGREYGDIKLLNAQKYADLRAEKNPIIRKAISKDNNFFKTFVISEQVLTTLYDMLSYADTQKYLAGLIAYPPSKINNELNQIKYVINRLGLEQNPVFIIGQGQNIILSSPDFLSLTGSSLFSKISMGQMKQTCQMDYTKALWNNAQMFKKLTAQKRDEDTANSIEDVKLQKTAVEKALKAMDIASAAYKKSIDPKAKLHPDEISKRFDELTNAKKIHTDAMDLYKITRKRYENAFAQVKDQEQVHVGQNLGTSQFTPRVDDSYKPKNSKYVEEYKFKKPGQTNQQSGFNSNQNRGGYNPNQNRGGYNPNQNRGGYNPNQNRYESQENDND